ncbi:MAG: bifunctional helix-turn-helix transcriptional regulator/GNAT family N-acetyltransferase [Acidobacteriaceae bacterium]
MPPKNEPELQQKIQAVRRFNRFYTRQIGTLTDGYAQSSFSLAEARVLYELAQQDPSTATRITAELGLDAGYLSRILRSFEQQGLITRKPCKEDGRQTLLRLTQAGRKEFSQINTVTNREVAKLLQPLTPETQQRLIAAMQTVEKLIAPKAGPPQVPYVLRPHRPGDMGWVIHRHGAIYAREYGWDERFEALVARIAADFIDHFDPRRERCWIAEREGEPVGSIFLVKHPEMPDTVAKLRLLLVEPSVRGLGIGRHLVKECSEFARGIGYRKITLWTQSILQPAIRIYREAGYRLVSEEKHSSFGKELTGQTWELEL